MKSKFGRMGKNMIVIKIAGLAIGIENRFLHLRYQSMDYLTDEEPVFTVKVLDEEIAAERDDIVVGKINVDDEMELARRFRIVSIPTIIVMKNGEKVSTAIGYKPKADILKLL